MTAEISIIKNDGLTIVKPENELLTVESLPQFKSEILGAYETNMQNMVIDLSNIKRLDSTVLGYFLYISNVMHNAGHKFGICSATGNVSMVLKMTRLDRDAIRVFSDLHEAEMELGATA